MIGDVGREVGRLSVFPDHHPILVVSVGGGFKPQRLPVGINKALLLQVVQKTPDAVFPVELLFAEIAVEGHAEIFQILPDPVQNDGAGDFVEALDRFVLVFAKKTTAFLPENLPGDFPDILSLVAVFRKFDFFPRKLPQAIQDGFAQIVHLVSRVVDVIFPGDGVAGRRQQVGENIPHHRPPRMADVQRPRRIGADKLQLDLFSFTDREAAEPVLLLQNIPQHAAP